MSRVPALLFALLVATVALLLGYGARFGVGGPRVGASAIGPVETGEGRALTGARPDFEAPELAPPPEQIPARDARASADAPVAAGPAAELTLEVVDDVTGRPVPAFFATVLPQGLHVQGREGAARFAGLPAGTVTIQVQGPEHEPAVASADLPSDRPVQVRLAQRTGLRGVVRFADARPASDVVLRLEPTGAAPTGAAPTATPSAAPGATRTPREAAAATQAKTDTDGRYRFTPLPPGRYSVIAEHLGRAFPPLGPVEVTAGMTDLPELRLDAGARLEIEVTDTGGLPRGEVLVVIVPAEGATLRRYSASDGKLSLEPLVPGRYTVTLPAQGGQAEQRRELELTVGLHRESFRADPPPGG